MYKLKTERKLNLKIINFEERKPSNVISELTDDGELSISFSFFNDDGEINLLIILSPNFEVTIKICEKNGNENNAKIITKEYVLGEQHVCLFESFKSNINYCVKIIIENPEDGLFSQWSEESEFTPEFKDLCVWKECPDFVKVDSKYFVNESNPRIATMNGGGWVNQCTIIGNTSLLSDKVPSWNVKILKSKDNNGNIFTLELRHLI